MKRTLPSASRPRAKKAPAAPAAPSARTAHRKKPAPAPALMPTETPGDAGGRPALLLCFAAVVALAILIAPFTPFASPQPGRLWRGYQTLLVREGGPAESRFRAAMARLGPAVVSQQTTSVDFYDFSSMARISYRDLSRRLDPGAGIPSRAGRAWGDANGVKRAMRMARATTAAKHRRRAGLPPAWPGVSVGMSAGAGTGFFRCAVRAEGAGGATRVFLRARAGSRRKGAFHGYNVQNASAMKNPSSAPAENFPSAWPLVLPSRACS